MKKVMSVILMAVMVTVLVGCATNIHIIGDGAKGTESVSAKQWYLLYGLIPLNNVDTKVMAGSATSYEIKTQANFIDGLIAYILGGGLISTRTVTVKK